MRVLGVWAVVGLCGCAPLSLSQFVDREVGSDPGLQRLGQAVERGQQAYHYIADTPIQQLLLPEASERASRLIDDARDAYRSARTYRIHEGDPDLSLDGVWLTDAELGVHRVDLDHTDARLEVEVLPEQVRLLAIETNRGKRIIRFTASMGLSVEEEFEVYLLGDAVDVESIRAIIARIRRYDLRGAADGWPDEAGQ